MSVSPILAFLENVSTASTTTSVSVNQATQEYTVKLVSCSILYLIYFIFNATPSTFLSIIL